MLSSIYFLDLKGKVLLSRDYRGDITPETAEKFIGLIGDLEDHQVPVTPVITCNGVNYIHIRHSNLYSTTNFLPTLTNPLIYIFLYVNNSTGTMSS